MRDARNEHQGMEIITMYAPIFREKLEKLERRGQGHYPEALKLREALARIDHAQAGPSLQVKDRRSLAASECSIQSTVLQAGCRSST